eukprot:2852085-Rhodomonas_salina.1
MAITFNSASGTQAVEAINSNTMIGHTVIREMLFSPNPNIGTKGETRLPRLTGSAHTASGEGARRSVAQQQIKVDPS